MLRLPRERRTISDESPLSSGLLPLPVPSSIDPQPCSALIAARGRMSSEEADLHPFTSPVGSLFPIVQQTRDPRAADRPPMISSFWSCRTKVCVLAVQRHDAASEVYDDEGGLIRIVGVATDVAEELSSPSFSNGSATSRSPKGSPIGSSSGSDGRSHSKTRRFP